MQCATNKGWRKAGVMIWYFYDYVVTVLGKTEELQQTTLYLLQQLGFNHISLALYLKKLVRWYSRVYASCQLACHDQELGNERRRLRYVLPSPASTATPMASDFKPSLSLGITVIVRQKKKCPHWRWFFFFLNAFRAVAESPIFVTYSKRKSSLWKVVTEILNTAF